MSRFIYKNSKYLLFPKCQIKYFFFKQVLLPPVWESLIWINHFHWKAIDKCILVFCERGCLPGFPRQQCRVRKLPGVVLETRCGSERTGPGSQSPCYGWGPEAGGSEESPALQPWRVSARPDALPWPLACWRPIRSQTHSWNSENSVEKMVLFLFSHLLKYQHYFFKKDMFLVGDTSITWIVFE